MKYLARYRKHPALLACLVATAALFSGPGRADSEPVTIFTA